jgi:hypothetical protein
MTKQIATCPGHPPLEGGAGSPFEKEGRIVIVIGICG